jgi:nucleoside-diphosphate-sugar epimerase
MTQNILVTGGTGFVGRHICAALERCGHRITLVTRAEKDFPKDEFQSVKRVISTEDLFRESSDWWSNACQGIDIVIHAAWFTEPGEYLQSTKNLDCLSGTLNLAKGCAQAGVKRFAGIGTCFEYDLSEGLLSTRSPLKPETPYAASKAATYSVLSEWLPTQAISFIWCRLFYLYGEGEDERRFVPYLRSKLNAGEPAQLTSGEQIRDYLDAREAGRLIAKAALSEHEGAANICSGVPTTIREFATRIAEEYGRTDLLHFGARPTNLVDPPSVIGIRSDFE